MLGKQVILLFAKAHEMKTIMHRATPIERDVTRDGLAAHDRQAINKNCLAGQGILDLLARCQLDLIEQLTESGRQVLSIQSTGRQAIERKLR